MGGKHKKFIRSEKAKVKLKGVKLPKGLNVTKTEFKIKKIVIKEQLKERVFEDGKRKQNIKEILTRLKHHNSSFRTDALRTLKDCVTSDPDQIFRSFGPLIQGISGLCLDIEKDIRRESYKVLSMILSLWPQTTIQPFFEILSSYLRCAMTHIQQSIQEDSLLMLDVLLLHIPSLIAANSNRIFSNFLDMISKFRTDAKPGRTLTTNVGNKVTTIKWRSKILLRLGEMLKTMIEHKKMSKSCQGSTSIENRKTFIIDEPMHFSLLRSNLNQNCNLSSIFNKSSAYNAENENESDRMKNYIIQLIPLLFESWLEVRSTDKEYLHFGQLLLTNDAASTLKIVLDILVNLWDLAMFCDEEENSDEIIKWLRSHCRQEFNMHILSGFPYQQGQGYKVTNQKAKGLPTEREIMESGGQNCLNQNLNIIYLFCVLNAPLKGNEREHATKILQFLTKIIPTTKQSLIDWILPLPKVIREILLINGTEFLQLDEKNTKALLNCILLGFEIEIFGRENKSAVLSIICDIILNNTLYKSYGCIEGNSTNSKKKLNCRNRNKINTTILVETGCRSFGCN